MNWFKSWRERRAYQAAVAMIKQLDALPAQEIQSVLGWVCFFNMRAREGTFYQFRSVRIENNEREILVIYHDIPISTKFVMTTIPYSCWKTMLKLKAIEIRRETIYLTRSGKIMLETYQLCRELEPSA